jgi:hypothetical protein
MHNDIERQLKITSSMSNQKSFYMAFYIRYVQLHVASTAKLLTVPTHASPPNSFGEMVIEHPCCPKQA